MIHIFTFLTDENRIQYLLQSATINNVKINYIINNKWNGYVDKIIAITNVIKNIAENDIICFIDAYDVLVNNSYSNLFEKFNSYNCEVLLGAELNCFPEIYKNRFPNTNTNYKYVNSGGYIGYKYAIEKIFNWKPIETIYDICKNGGDQTYFIEYYLNNQNEKIKLDDKCLIFQNMHQVSWNEISFNSGKMFNNILQTYPCFIHFNGGTWQQNNKENIMPVFLSKMEETIVNPDLQLNLHEFNQIITQTCYPLPQI